MVTKSKSKKKFYITTAIDYVNAKPHVGHAFEKVLADALARWKRLQGEKVFFLTGVDENAQKNVQAAEKAGMPVKEFIDKNAASFLELCKKLNISYDDFIRTTAKEHAVTVQKIVKKLIDKKDIYKKVYEGLYCTGCETYYTEKDLNDGKCPEHGTAPELRKEEAYFFKLSKYKNQLIKLIPKYVTPEAKANEVLFRVKGELNDICISRKGAKWGIDFPNDKDYKIWVWVDALINYISGADGNWPADVHVIGKGINWFHSVIWPAILISAKYKLPKTLLVHGYLNIGGQKMSKSLGNVIDPIELINKYGSDSVRYSLLKCSVFDDSDFSEEMLVSRHNNELANKFGNLVSRVSALAEKNGIQKTPNKLIKKLNLKQIQKHLDNYEFDKALNEIFAFTDICNEYVQEKQPWVSGDKKVLYELADSIKAISILLWPFMPSTSEKVAKTFGFEISLKDLKNPLKESKINKSDILFQKIEILNNQKTIKQPTPTKNMIEGIANINFEDWSKIDLRVGEIESIEDIQGADKLYKLTVNIGANIKTVCAGLKQFYSKDDLKGKKVILFSNLAPRKMRGIESQGMLLAAVNKDETKVSLLQPDEEIEIGSKVM